MKNPKKATAYLRKNFKKVFLKLSREDVGANKCEFCKCTASNQKAGGWVTVFAGVTFCTSCFRKAFNK